MITHHYSINTQNSTAVELNIHWIRTWISNETLYSIMDMFTYPRPNLS